MDDNLPPRGPLVPPVYLVLALGIMALLHYFLPVAVLLPDSYRLLGAVLILLSLAIGFWAVGLFRRADTGVVPFSPVKTLVAHGPYRFTRNPMYLGMAGLLLGAAILFGTLAPFLIVPVFVALIEWRFILAEEAFLAAELGEAYAEYKAKVRRWL